jgi:L-galactose dehydrogenase
MRHKKLGNTDLHLSVVGFGASPLGDVFAITDPSERIRAVHYAIEQGINFFDVSPYYGITLAETRLGEALAGKRHEVIVATKCGRYGANDFDFSHKTVVAGVDASLSRLKTDYVDLLQVHDVEFGDIHQIITETLPALRLLQKSGKARYIGITGYSLSALQAIAEAVEVDAILSYCRYNLLVRDMDESLTPFAKKNGIGLINASPLHMGILSPNTPPDWHPAPPRVRDAGIRANEISVSHGVKLTELSLRFCLAHPDVTSTLVGMSTVRQVEENLRALLPADDQAVIEEITKAVGHSLNYVWPSGSGANEKINSSSGSEPDNISNRPASVFSEEGKSSLRLESVPAKRGSRFT